MRNVQHLAAKLGLARLAGIGLSLGPFHTSEDERRCAEFLKRFEYLAVRDHASCDLARSMDLPYEVVQSRDLAGLLPAAVAPQTAASDARRPLGVALCNYESYAGGDVGIEKLRNEAFFAAVSEFASERRTLVRIFCLNVNPATGEDDICRQLAARLDDAGVEHEVVSATDGVVGVWRRIAECSAMVSIRLHGGISAYLAGVPFCLVEYHGKCTDFLDDVGQHGSLRIASEVDSPDAILAVLAHLTQAPRRPELSPAIYKEESKLNFSAAPWAAETAKYPAEGIDEA